MRIFLTCLLVVIGSWSLAAVAKDQAAAAVKVISFPCELPGVEQLEMRGSGVVLKRNGRTLIVSSDHVVYHGNQAQGFCHRVRVGNLQLEAKLVGVSLGHGLALLEVDSQKLQVNSLSYEKLYRDLNRCDSHQYPAIQSRGYTWRSQSLTLAAGRVVNHSSRRHLLANIETLYEAVTYTELGMSGAPVFEEESQAFVGILSHQSLLPELGKESQLSMAQTDGSIKIGLVIPVCRVTLWLTDILSGSSSFALEPESQLHGQESGVIDQVRFQVSQCEVISKSDYEIGGRKHVPKQKRLDIGRLVTRSNVKSSTGDGVGIGGGHDTKFDRCKIQLSWQSKVGHSGWPLTHHQAWFLAVRSAVHKRAQVVIDSVLLDGEIYELNGSLARFFALLQRGGLPMTRVSSLNHPEAQSLTELQAVVEEVKVSLTAIESPWAQLSAGKPLLRVLWQDLLEVVAKVEGGHYQMICSSRLTQMIHSKAWSSLYLSPTINIDHVIGLKADLNKLRNTLDLLTITRGCQ